MEHFDVFSKYYITKVQKLHHNVPGSLRELLPRVNTIPTARRSSQIPKTQVDQMLQTEEEIGDSFISLFGKSSPSK